MDGHALLPHLLADLLELLFLGVREVEFLCQHLHVPVLASPASARPWAATLPTILPCLAVALWCTVLSLSLVL